MMASVRPHAGVGRQPPGIGSPATPVDAICVAARSDLANGGSAHTVFGVGANCYKWGDVKSPQ